MERCCTCISECVHNGPEILSKKERDRERLRLHYEANRDAVRERTRLWKESHPERVRELAQRRYAENRDAILATDKARYEADREPRIRAAVEWNRANPERRKAITKKYAEAHRDEIREAGRLRDKNDPETALLRVYKRRARKVAASGSFTVAEWYAIVRRQRGSCAHCGEKCRLTKDHIVPLSRGGSDFAFNIQGLCLRCNSAKGASIAAGLQHSLFDRVLT